MRNRRNGLLCGALVGVAALVPTAPAAVIERAGPVILEQRTVATSAGARPFFRNAGRGAVGGINGTFFLLASNAPSCGFVLHNGLNRTGINPVGGGNELAFGADGAVTPSSGDPFGFFGRTGQSVNVAGRPAGVWTTREATCGKPVVVRGGRAQTGPGGLTSAQASPAVHRSAVGVLGSGQSALVVAGGAGLPHAAFARALQTIGFRHALGLDLNSASTLNWKGRSINRPGTERRIPTGIIVFSR